MGRVRRRDLTWSDTNVMKNPARVSAASGCSKASTVTPPSAYTVFIRSV